MAKFSFREKDAVATEWIDQWVHQSYKAREPHEEGWRENWSNYRVEPYGIQTTDAAKMDPYGNYARQGVGCLKTPESHQITNALRSTLLASLFGIRDYIQAIPVGDEDVEAAAAVSKLIMNGIEQRGNFRTQWDMLGDAIIFGTGTYFAGWRAVTKSVPRRLPILGADGAPMLDPETGRPITVLQNVDVLVEDDVALRPRSIWDIFHDPAADRFEEARGIVEKFKIDEDTLDALMRAPSYDAEGIAAVLLDGPSGKKPTGPDDRDDPKLITEELTEEDVADIEDYGIYGGWRFHGMLPAEVAEGLGLDPRASATVAIVNGKIIQAAQSPQKDGELPFGTLTILPTGRGLYGLSPLTVVRYLQDVSDTQLILTVQALIESVYQNYIIGSGLGGQTNLAKALESRKPRQNFTVEGEVDQLVPLAKDYSGVQIAVQALSLISQTMRDASNARDPVQGIVGQGNVTATQTQITATSALSNVDQLAVLIERDELPRQGRLINGLYYINLDDDGKVFRRIGDSEATEVSFFDIDSVSDIRFVGARNAMNKVGKSTQFRDFMQLVLSTPIGAASIDWNMFIRKYEDEVLDVKGLDQVLINDPEEILARLQAMGLATSGPPQARNSSTPNEAGATRPERQSEGTAA